MRSTSDTTGFLAQPVKGVSAAFAVLFTVSGFLHIWQNTKHKSWSYGYFLPCACFLFTASFICREYTANHPTTDATITAIPGLFYSGALIITAPLYLFLHPLLATHGSLVPIRPIYLYIFFIFITYAILSITAQGAATFFNPDATDAIVSSGLALIQASLIMQLVLNIAFVAIVGIFHSRCSSHGIFKQSGEQRLKSVTNILYISIAWILVRNIFSTIQIFLPSDSPAWTVEAYFWVFSATPMLAYTVFLNIWHPSKYLQGEANCCVATSAPERVGDAEAK